MQSVSQMICVILQKYFQLNFPIGAPPPLSNYFLSQSTSQAGQASTIQSWAGQGGTRLRQAGEGGHSKDTPTLLGHSCKIGNMRCPGTLKNKNPQFEEKK